MLFQRVNVEMRPNGWGDVGIESNLSNDATIIAMMKKNIVKKP